MHQLCVILLSLVLSITCYSQKKIAPLPSELHESSTLIKYKNNFLTINDSENEPIIYVFNQKGVILHTCFIKNGKNRDWEAMAYDGKQFLYIGDIGNDSFSLKNKNEDSYF